MFSLQLSDGELNSFGFNRRVYSLKFHITKCLHNLSIISDFLDLGKYFLFSYLIYRFAIIYSYLKKILELFHIFFLYKNEYFSLRNEAITELVGSNCASNLSSKNYEIYCR